MSHQQRQPKVYTVLQAKTKAESYCAFQERSQQEVRDKLYSWGLHNQEIEEVISLLIEDNFINEERFALSYTRGKFNLKGWGKIKIQQGLKYKQVSPPLIKIALQSIDRNDYYTKLEEIISKKSLLIQETNLFMKKNKLAQYALSRGFESHLIWEIINNLYGERDE